MADQRTAIVVGAGAGGIATAARLAKAGFKVTVLEKNDFTGGRCSLIHHNGYVREFMSSSALFRGC
jgi:phytoene desaturase (3,4-didehydrolycopene-forming)